MWNPFRREDRHLQYLSCIYETQLEILKRMASLTDLQSAIDAAPAAIASAVVAEVTPLIGAPIDTQPQIDAVNALAAKVADAVKAGLTPLPPPTI